MRKLSLAALTVLDLPPQEMITCAQKIGFNGIGLRLIPATVTEPSYNFKEGSNIVKECLARLRDGNVEVTDIEILRLLPETNILDFEEILAIGAEFGATSALLAVDDPDAQRSQDNLLQIAELSKKYGIMPHVEFMPWLEINTLGKAIELLRPLESENISVLLDTIHFNRSHSNLLDWQKYQGKKPAYLQLCDTPTKDVEDMEEILAQARAERRAPGEGFIEDLADIVRALPLDTILSLEVPEKHKSAITAYDRAHDIFLKTKQWLTVHNL